MGVRSRWRRIESCRGALSTGSEQEGRDRLRCPEPEYACPRVAIWTGRAKGAAPLDTVDRMGLLGPHRNVRRSTTGPRFESLRAQPAPEGREEQRPYESKRAALGEGQHSGRRHPGNGGEGAGGSVVQTKTHLPAQERHVLMTYPETSWRAAASVPRRNRRPRPMTAPLRPRSTLLADQPRSAPPGGTGPSAQRTLRLERRPSPPRPAEWVTCCVVGLAVRRWRLQRRSGPLGRAVPVGSGPSGSCRVPAPRPPASRQGLWRPGSREVVRHECWKG